MHTRSLVKNLRSAIALNDINTVREILSKNPELANTPEMGKNKTFFWEAMLKGCKEMVELFVDFGADVNEKLLIATDPAGRCFFNMTFLESVVYMKNNWQKRLKVAEILIKSGAALNSVSNPTSQTVLQMALQKGNLDYAEFLLKNGARLEGPECNCRGPMYHVLKAPKTHQNEILQLLIRYGLDINTVNKDDDNCFFFFLRSGFSLSGDHILKMAKIFLDSGVPTDGLSKSGRSALHYAIYLKNIELVSLLIERGANVNLKSMLRQGAFPLCIASHKDYTKIINLLLLNGAEIDAKTFSGHTALHQACRKRNELSIRMLLQKGADISAEDNNGKTPFFFLEPQKYNESDVPCINVMVRELARRNFCDNLAVSQKDLDLIQTHSIVRQFFQDCMKEVCVMSSTKFYGFFTYYSVIDMSNKKVKKLANLTKNKEFVSKFGENLHKFQCYVHDLLTILDEAIQVNEESVTVESRLKTALSDFFPDVVIRKLADNLCVDDLPSES